MGYWGVKSYENDDAHEALDSGFAAAHPRRYEELMDDANSMTLEQVQKELANESTLAESMRWLEGAFGSDLSTWDEEARLAFVGVIVRHVELQVPIDEVVVRRALDWLADEDFEWDEPTKRRLRRENEAQALQRHINLDVRRG